jgi:hypothetical protein
MLPSTNFTLAAVAGLLSVGVAGAQSLPAPKIAHVMPAGGQAGATFEVTVTGSDLDKAEGLYFSFPGAKTEAVGASEKAPPVEVKKKGGGAMKAPGPQLTQKFKVTLPANAPLGIQDVRVVTKGGVSNPRAFVVSDMKEVVEQEPNDNVDKAQKIDLNAAVSGVIAAPTDVDYYRFTGRKGQRVILSCLTTSIDSKLPAQLELYSAASDKFLGSGRGYYNNDALVDVTLPEDGDYLVRLFSFTYTLGGPDYFYRLAVSTAPWIDAVVPAIVEAGKETRVTVYGRNLPQGALDPASVVDGKTLEKTTVTVKAPSDPQATQRLAYTGLVVPNASALDGFELRLKNDAGTSNPYLIGFARGPVAVDNEMNGTPETAQPIQVPGAVAGRLQKKGDRDYYSFAAKKGQVLTLELFSDRLGAPTDLYFEVLSVKDGQTTTLTRQEDTPDTFGNQFPSPTYDPPSYRFTAPADGTYQVLVTSLEALSQFGPRHVYTLHVTEDEPDFRLIAMPVANQGPDSVTLGQGGHQAYSLLIWRLRGFVGDITLSGESLPPGVTMKPQIVAGNQKQAAFVVSADPEAPPTVGALKIVGSAVIGGKKVVREVRAATITWPIPQQQNIPTIGRLNRELVLAIRDKVPYQLNLESDNLTVLQGDRLTVPLKVAFAAYKGNVSLVALALPTGMVMQPVTVAPGKEAVKLNFDSKTTVLPGTYTLIVRGQTQDPKLKPPTKPGGPANLVQAAAPITVTVVPKQLAKLAVPNNVKVAAGKEAELVVRLTRQFEYAGTFKVEVIVPAGAKEISVEPVTLKAGEDEAKLTIRAANATVGQTSTLVVRATAMFNDTVPVVHETKVNLVVTK